MKFKEKLLGCMSNSEHLEESITILLCKTVDSYGPPQGCGNSQSCRTCPMNLVNVQ